MSRPALPEERGADLQRDPADPVPEELRHELERIDDSQPDYDGPPYDHRVVCGRSDRVGSINPFGERCPAQERPSAVEVRAETAEADDSQASLTGACARTDGGRSP